MEETLTTLFIVLIERYKTASKWDIKVFEKLTEELLSHEDNLVAGFIIEEMRYFRKRDVSS
jgi:hypothetical protein